MHLHKYWIQSKYIQIYLCLNIYIYKNLRVPVHGDTNLQSDLKIDHFIFPMPFKYTLKDVEISHAEVMKKRDKMLIKGLKFWTKLFCLWEQ